MSAEGGVSGLADQATLYDTTSPSYEDGELADVNDSCFMPSMPSVEGSMPAMPDMRHSFSRLRNSMPGVPDVPAVAVPEMPTMESLQRRGSAFMSFTAPQGGRSMSESEGESSLSEPQSPPSPPPTPPSTPLVPDGVPPPATAAVAAVPIPSTPTTAPPTTPKPPQSTPHAAKPQASVAKRPPRRRGVYAYLCCVGRRENPAIPDDIEQGETECKEMEPSPPPSGEGKEGAAAVADSGEPDAAQPLISAQQTVPRKFAEAYGTSADTGEAERKWNVSRQWRIDENIDSMLQRPQPCFDLIKENYPHYFGGRSKDGSLCYYELLGQVNMRHLKDAGLSVADLVDYYVFMMEYLWTCACHEEEGSRSYSVNIFDVEGVSIINIVGDVLTFIKAVSKIAEDHYPARSHYILIVNAPLLFTTVWRLVKPMLSASTTDKIRISRPGDQTTQEMLRLIDLDQLPDCYGGKLDLKNSPEEVAYRHFVHDMHRKHGLGEPPYRSKEAWPPTERSDTESKECSDAETKSP